MEFATQIGKTCRRRPAMWLFAAALALICGPTPALAQSAPSLEVPIDCVPGKSCWIAKFVDLDPGPGVRDYTCHGRANDGHTGIDIALRDRRAMDEGVSVLAAASGTVLRTRDGVPDISVRDRPGPLPMGECGNGVIIDHGGGWMTQYCHMHEASIEVTPGQHVVTGQKLGLVGMSGSTEYPHLHFSVYHDGKIVDPFVGLEERSSPAAKCGLGDEPLWSSAALAAFAYQPASIYNIGFAGDRPDEKDIDMGRYRDTQISPDAPFFVFWSEIFGVEKGDQLRLLLLGPDGQVLLDHIGTIPARKARWFQYVGKRRPSAGWPGGTYRGEVTLTRVDPDGTKTVTRRLDATVVGPAVPAGTAAPPPGTPATPSPKATAAAAPALPSTKDVTWLLIIIVAAFLIVLVLWAIVHFIRKT